MDLEEYKKWFNDNNDFSIYIGSELTVLEDQYAEVELQAEKMHGNINGTVHGGVLLTLADIAVGAASKSRGSASATLEGKMNFIRPARLGMRIRAVAKALHAGRKTGVYECNLYDEEEHLLAVSIYTMFMLEKPLADRN